MADIYDCFQFFGKGILAVIEKKKTHIYMEYLRTISALGVIMTHVSAAGVMPLEIGSFSRDVCTMYNMLGRFSVCIFCMISGALMLSPEKRTDIRMMLGRYIKRLLICYALWSVLYAVLYTLHKNGNIRYFVRHIFTPSQHLWYIPMIACLYLITPILRKITADRDATRLLIWILVIAATFFGTVSSLTTAFDEVAGDGILFFIWRSLINFVNGFNYGFVPGYLGYYLLGHYLHEYGIGKWHEVVVITAIPLLFISGMLTNCFCRVTGNYVQALLLETNPLLVVSCVGIYELFKGPFEKPKTYDESSGLTSFTLLCGSHTFMIYLVHVAVLEILDWTVGINALSYNPIIMVPVNTLIVFALSLLFSIGVYFAQRAVRAVMNIGIHI